jgi:hypothetical protein
MPDFGFWMLDAVYSLSGYLVGRLPDGCRVSNADFLLYLCIYGKIS